MGRSLLVLAVLFALPSIVHAASPPPDRRGTSLPPLPQRALIRSGSNAYDAATGAARRLYGVTSEPFAGDAVTAALRYLGRESASFGLSADLSEMQLTSVHRGAGTQHVRFRQRWNGIPVWASDVVVSLTDDGRVTGAASDAWPGVVLPTSSPALDVTRAKALAARHEGIEPEDVRPCSELFVYPLVTPARLAWRVTFRVPGSPSWMELFVDATTGEVLSSRDLTWYVDGTGFVFDPDPLTTGHVVGQPVGYRDSSDLASPQLNAQRRVRALRDIRLSGGVYSLEGPYVRIENIENPPEPYPYTATHADSFRFTRADSSFEAVMVYYHIDTIQRWIQSLGLTAANNDSQRCDPHGADGADNSWYVPNIGCGIPSGDYIAFGQGGVDDAEDAGVILHEYGHAIHDDQVPGWGLFIETRAMGEGFGDYLAASYAASIDSFNQNWVMKWDGSLGAPDSGLRKVVTNKRYPQDLHPSRSVHRDGEMWSASLWQIRGLLGRTISDRIILQSHHYLLPGASFRDGAEAILEADARLYAGAHLTALRAIFEARGILGPEPFAISHMEQARAVSVALDERQREGGRNFFVVWQDEIFPAYDIHGARVAASGAVIETDVPIAVSADIETSPDIAYVARIQGPFARDSFLVVYNRSPECNDCGCLTVQDVWGAWVDANGDTSRHFLITTESFQGGNLPRTASVVDGNGQTLVVWAGEFSNADDCSIVKQGLFAARVDVDTGLMDPGGFFIAPTAANYGWDVAYGAGRFLVVWDDFGNIRGAIVHPDTSITGPFDVSTEPGQDASLTFDGTQFLVVWQQQYGDIYAARVDTLGSVVTPGPFRVTRTQWGDYNPVVAARDSVAMVAWTYTPIDLSTSTEHYEIRGTTIPPYAPDSVDVSWTIARLDLPGVAPVNFGPAIAFGGQSFLVAFEDSLPTHIVGAVVGKYARDSFLIDVPDVPVGAPAVLSFGAPHPNPTRAASLLSFAMPTAGHASLQVFDVAGRVVRTVLDQNLAAGPHRALWDGQDRSGRRVPSGVYFLRLTTPAGARTRRVVLRP